VLLFSLGASKEVAITSKQWTFPSAPLSRSAKKSVCVGGVFAPLAKLVRVACSVGLRALGVSVCVGRAVVGVVRVRCSCWRMSRL
jgi:hypothetical protein